MSTLRSIITDGPYTSGEISRRMSTNTPQILMMAMYFSYLVQFCMKAFGMPTVATYLSSSASMIHVVRTDLVTAVGDISSSLDIKSL